MNSPKCLVVCHGKTEMLFVNHIKSVLRTNAKIDAEKKGRNSIQITSLMKFLNRYPYKDEESFKSHYHIADMKGFKIFPIMDCDDCTMTEKINYINKSMFNKHWMHKYIHPIHNTNNLEDVFSSTNLPMYSRKNDVVKIFPLKKGLSKEESILIVKDELEKTKDSNLNELIDFMYKNKP